MLAVMMISLTIAVLLAATTAMAIAVKAEPSPSVVGFPAGRFDAADTLATAYATSDTLAGDWQSVEMTRLCDVEAFLDSLEASHVQKTELEINDNRFVVRWR